MRARTDSTASTAESASTGGPSRLDEYRAREAAQRYDERWAGARGARRNARKVAALRSALRTLLPDGPTAATILLDAPCGTARFAALWRELGLRALGVDGSPEMLQVADHATWPGVMVVGDLAALPVREVEVAVCIRFMHLVRDASARIEFLRELARVARRGAIVDYRHGATPRGFGRRARASFARLFGRTGPRIWPSPAAIRAELEAAGFSVLARIGVRRPWWIGDKLLFVVAPSAPLS